MDKDKQIGKTISYLRKAHNMTQEDLGKKLGVNGKNVSKWENNVTIPDYIMLKKISEVFNVSIDEIITNNITNKDSKFKVKKNYIICIFVFIIIIMSFICVFLILKEDNKTFNISSDSSEIEFKGYIFLSKEKNIITVNTFKYIGNNGNDIVKQFDVYLKNDEKIIYAYYSDELNDNFLDLNEVIRNLSIDIIEIDEENIEVISNDKLSSIRFVIEYITKDYENKSIISNLIIDNVI